MNYPYRSYYRTNETRFGPLLPFVGGLIVGGLFLPRPNGGFMPGGPSNVYPNQGPVYQSPHPTYQTPPPMYGSPLTSGPIYYGPLPYPTNNYMPVINQETSTYFTSLQADNIDIYPYQNASQPY